MSDLDTRLTTTLATALNELVPGGGASAARMSFGELLERIHNAVSDGPDLSRLTSSTSKMVAGIRNALIAGAPVSHLTTSVPAMLAAIRNELSDDPDVSRLNTRASALWDLAFTSVGQSTGGGAPSVPGWVPAGSTGFVDFEHSRAWLPATGTISDLTTVRNPAMGDCIGALFDRMAQQDYAALVTYEVTGTTPDQGGNLIVEMNDGGSSGLEVYTYANGSGDLSAFASSFDGSYDAAQTGIVTGEHLLAFQLNASVGVQSTGDGEAVVTDGVPYAPFTQAICQLAAFNIAHVVIKSIALFENTLTAPQLQVLSRDGRVVPAWFAPEALNGATGGVDWTAADGAAYGQAYFNDALITNLGQIHGGGFDQVAVTSSGMAVLTGNANRPTIIGPLLDALTDPLYAVYLEGAQSTTPGGQDAALFTVADDFYDPSTVWFNPYVVSDSQIVHIDINSPGAVGRCGLWPTGVTSKFALSFNSDGYVCSANNYPAQTSLGALLDPMIMGWLGFKQSDADPDAPQSVNSLIQNRLRKMFIYPTGKDGAWCETITAGGWAYQGGSAVSGSPSVTLDATTGVNVGDLIYGFGVAPGTTVLAIDGGTHVVTMSANATATGSVKLYGFKAP